MNEFLNGKRPKATTTTESVAAAATRRNFRPCFLGERKEKKRKMHLLCVCVCAVVGATSGKARGSAGNDVILYDRNGCARRL